MMRRHHVGISSAALTGRRFQGDGPKKRPSQDMSRNPGMSDGTPFRPQDFSGGGAEAFSDKKKLMEKYPGLQAPPLYVWNVGSNYDPNHPTPEAVNVIPNRYQVPTPVEVDEEGKKPMPGARKTAGGGSGSGSAPPPNSGASTESFNSVGPEPGSAGSESRSKDTVYSKPYVRSQEFFAEHTVNLRESFAGDEDKAQIATWEKIYYDYTRWLWTGERLAGKDRHGNVFTLKYDQKNPRQEKRFCWRAEHNKRHLPYGALPNDSKNWSIWMRGQRNQVPTWAEEEQARVQTLAMMGAKVVGDEAPEDTIIRNTAHTAHASALLQELDTDESYNKFVHHYEVDRMKENNPQRETSTWTVGFSRADWLYNEEDAETMRTSLGHVYRDREWQALEAKRHKRMQTHKRGHKYPHVNDEGEPVEGTAMTPIQPRGDGWIPCLDGIEELTTPEIQKLKTECDYLEDDRLALRNELGLTDVTDIHEGRAPIQRDDNSPFGMDPVSKRFKPKIWNETWGVGGGKHDHGPTVDTSVFQR